MPYTTRDAHSIPKCKDLQSLNVSEEREIEKLYIFSSLMSKFLDTREYYRTLWQTQARRRYWDPYGY